jgi:type II secretory pathway component PulF
LGQGLPLGEVLRGRRLVPELIAWMTGLGEQRGTLGKTLHQVADIYRRQAEMRAALLRSVLPPFLIIGTAGVLVALFVMVIVLPMMKLIEAFGQ